MNQPRLKNRSLVGYNGQFVVMRYEHRARAPVSGKTNDKLALVFGVYVTSLRLGEVRVFTEVQAGSIKGGNKDGSNPEFKPRPNRGIARTLVASGLWDGSTPSKLYRSFNRIMRQQEWYARISSKELDFEKVYRASTTELWIPTQTDKHVVDAAYREMTKWFQGYDPFEGAVEYSGEAPPF